MTLKKVVSVFLMALMVSGVAFGYFGKVNAESSIPKPSVPEFTLKYVDDSYDVPPTYGVDPYTGKTVLTQAGYHIQNASVELIIKNQPYHSYRNENGSLVWLFYYIAVKGHFENWTTINWTSYWMNQKSSESHPDGFTPSSDSEYTVITYGLVGDNGTDTAYKYRSSTAYNSPFYYGYYDYTLGNVSVGDQVDFRVQAIIGYSTRINETLSVPPIGLEPGDVPHYYIFTGQSSDWSNTQTVTIGDNTTIADSGSSPSPSAEASNTPEKPTATSQQPGEQLGILFGLGWSEIIIIVLLAVIAVLLAAAVVYLRKRSVKRAV
jgi:hypothetical protein